MSQNDASTIKHGAVLIIDDHDLIAQGLALALRAQGLEPVVASTPDRDRVLDLVRRHRPVLALLDLQFAGSAFEGVDLIEPLDASCTPVLVLTGVSDPAILGACLEAGAIGVASKAEPFDRLLERIDLALRGATVLSVREREDLLEALHQRRADEAARMAPFQTLSPREGEVLDLLARGLAADAIASATFVSVATVRTHIQAILRKLEVNSQLAAVALARECAWSLDTASSS